ncbi:hypothetical protein UFOVP784_212 [uncultured Caudovirales phage]|uniref:Uncharacterized protein n=1 Tax=uncultured Caudovirales phage TaxID=2100421 RepID=A0A6J5NU45_9CAUD|nr:hypothetical protein UFOVP436_212 [uncultured Caudovirales phage]CAB4162979.1 hypothetical protein UFOVP784_212 [uncultured Caudovirales phage]
MCGILFPRSQMLSLGGAKVPPIELNIDYMNTNHFEWHQSICLYAIIGKSFLHKRKKEKGKWKI